MFFLSLVDVFYQKKNNQACSSDQQIELTYIFLQRELILKTGSSNECIWIDSKRYQDSALAMAGPASVKDVVAVA